MNNNIMNNQMDTDNGCTVAQDGSFSTTVGRTTYVVGVFFSKESKESYDDKAKKLIMNDLKTGNF